MNLDYDLIKNILTFVKDKSDGFNVIRIADADVVNFSEQAYHYKILQDNGFINGSIGTISCRGNHIPYEIQVQGLTLEGHKLLEAMEKDNVWNKVKKTAITLGVEGLKQIPALALTLLTKD